MAVPIANQISQIENATRIGIAVVEHDGRYLVGTRGPDSPLPGFAEFPGGKCRSGEPPQQCARRECLEETGLRAQPIELLLNKQFTYPHGAVDLHFWLFRPIRSEEICADHQGFRWVAADGLRALRFPEANREVVERLASRPARSSESASERA